QGGRGPERVGPGATPPTVGRAGHRRPVAARRGNQQDGDLRVDRHLRCLAGGRAGWYNLYSATVGIPLVRLEATYMARRGADCELNGVAIATRRSDRFLSGLKDVSSVSFVSHVHPDPDSLGSMMGLAHLVEVCLDKPTRLVRDGLISRAENKAMVELLDIDLHPIEDVTWAEGEALVMVDSQPNTGRHNLDGEAPLYGVIDHHD